MLSNIPFSQTLINYLVAIKRANEIKHMEYRFIIHYTADKQKESVEFISESPQLTQEEARKIVEKKLEPYRTKSISNIFIVQTNEAEKIDTDPETSASE